MKLSIITINYNNCEGLRKTIESVVNQTWKEFEWIIVDGGSTDGSRELIEETDHRLEGEGWDIERFSLLGFTAEDWKNDTPSTPQNFPQLKWTSEKDKGIYNAMNKGIVMSQGEYCLFLNSGDCLYEKGVLKQLHTELDGTDFVTGDVFLIKEDGMRIRRAENPAKVTSFWMIERFIWHQGIFIRASMLKERLYDERMKISADWEEMFVELLVNNRSYKHIDSIISLYLVGGLSSDDATREMERNEVVSRYYSKEEVDDIRLQYYSKEGTEESFSLMKDLAYLSFVTKKYSQSAFNDVFGKYRVFILKCGTFYQRFFLRLCFDRQMWLANTLYAILNIGRKTD